MACNQHRPKLVRPMQRLPAVHDNTAQCNTLTPLAKHNSLCSCRYELDSALSSSHFQLLCPYIEEAAFKALALPAARDKLSQQCRPASKSHSHSAHRHFDALEPSVSRTIFPHDPFRAFTALLKEIREVHIIDFLYQTEPPYGKTQPVGDFQ